MHTTRPHHCERGSRPRRGGRPAVILACRMVVATTEYARILCPRTPAQPIRAVRPRSDAHSPNQADCTAQASHTIRQASKQTSAQRVSQNLDGHLKTSQNVRNARARVAHYWDSPSPFASILARSERCFWRVSVKFETVPEFFRETDFNPDSALYSFVVQTGPTRK